MDCKRCGVPLEDGRYKCLACGKINIIPAVEESRARVLSLSDAPDAETKRLGSKEWCAPILGGGIVYRQLTLVGGPPGSGKSTWMIQLFAAIAKERKRRALIIPTEEACQEVKARVKRLGYDTDLFVYPEDAQDETLDCLNDEEEFAIVGLDSVQDLTGEDPMEAVRVLTIMKEYSVAHDTPTFAINHVNKDEEFAGLMRLKHKVDTAILILGDDEDPTRRMLIPKNRFGQSHKNVELTMMGEEDQFPGRLYPVKGASRQSKSSRKSVKTLKNTE